MSDPKSEALKMMPYGFYVITSKTDDDENAMVLNWITQASYEPQLIALGLQKTSHSYSLIEKGKVFGVNIFKQADADIVKGFTKGRTKNPDKMKNANYTNAPETGVPIIEGAAAYLECKVVGKLETGGDHDIILGEVVAAGVNKPGDASESLNLPDLGWSYAG